jgi:Bacterial PH domain
LSAHQKQSTAGSQAAEDPARQAGDGAGPLTFRSPFAVAMWWVWLLFALANLIDLAVQGRDHFSVVAAFILLLVTGVVYTTAQRPRIIAGDDSLTIVNPVREHRIGWAAVSAVEATDLIRVRCEWPAGDAGGRRNNRVIYSWAVGSSRRRQANAEMRANRARPRPPRGGGAAGSAFATPADNGQPPLVGDVGPVVSALGAYAERARAVAPRQQARPPVSTWYWPAVAAIVLPALALVIAVLT